MSGPSASCPSRLSSRLTCRVFFLGRRRRGRSRCFSFLQVSPLQHAAFTVDGLASVLVRRHAATQLFLLVHRSSTRSPDPVQWIVVETRESSEISLLSEALPFLGSQKMFSYAPAGPAVSGQSQFPATQMGYLTSGRNWLLITVWSTVCNLFSPMLYTQMCSADGIP